MNMKKKPLRQSRKIDQSLLWVMILLVSFGILMVYSSSVVWVGFDKASHAFIKDPFALVGKHIAFVAIGLVLALLAFAAGMRFWERASLWVLMVSIALLAVLLLGPEVNGAKRWLDLKVFKVQPSEIFKLGVILYLAAFFCRRADVLGEKKSMIFPGGAVGAGLGFVLLEPDLGATVILMMIAFCMLFLANLPAKWFGTGLAAGAVGLVVAILASPYRIKRVMVFIDPWAQAFDKGYQTTHALMGIARGGWTGLGLGAGVEKRFYMTNNETHTDFIFTTIGEEFGMVGILLVIAAYAWLCWRAFVIARKARDLEKFFNAYVAKGIGIWIGIQSFFHMGVNIGILPPKGLPLPLVSYGGSMTVVMLVAFGLLLRIDYENRMKVLGFDK
ncbi:MAG: putative lipid II flippase FtsW [Neisseria sp.]|nr:putative lipid II flippase FtsW [Neisseria sp.]